MVELISHQVTSNWRRPAVLNLVACEYGEHIMRNADASEHFSLCLQIGEEFVICILKVKQKYSRFIEKYMIMSLNAKAWIFFL